MQSKLTIFIINKNFFFPLLEINVSDRFIRTNQLACNTWYAASSGCNKNTVDISPSRNSSRNHWDTIYIYIFVPAFIRQKLMTLLLKKNLFFFFFKNKQKNINQNFTPVWKKVKPINANSRPGFCFFCLSSVSLTRTMLDDTRCFWICDSMSCCANSFVIIIGDTLWDTFEKVLFKNIWNYNFLLRWK